MGITGDCEFVCLDGPSVVVRLTGRFWHEKSAVREKQWCARRGGWCCEWGLERKMRCAEKSTRRGRDKKESERREGPRDTENFVEERARSAKNEPEISIGLV